MTLSRAKFNELTADLVDATMGPVQQALNDAGLKASDLNKILLVHYAHHGELLTRLHHLYGTLKTDLEEHFAREEKLVFPLMREYPQPGQDILTLVQDLEDDHTAAGNIIKEIEELTDHFTAPADACATFKRTYQLLEEFINDVFVHIFKENSIVFPEYAEQAAN